MGYQSSRCEFVERWKQRVPAWVVSARPPQGPRRFAPHSTRFGIRRSRANPRGPLCEGLRRIALRSLHSSRRSILSEHFTLRQHSAALRLLSLGRATPSRTARLAASVPTKRRRIFNRSRGCLIVILTSRWCPCRGLVAEAVFDRSAAAIT